MKKRLYAGTVLILTSAMPITVLASGDAVNTNASTSNKQKLDQPAPQKYKASVCNLFSAEDAAKLLGMPVGAGKKLTIITFRSCNYSHSKDNAVHVAINEKANKDIFQQVTSSSPGPGWSIWLPVKGLGQEAKITSRDNAYQLDILIPHKIVYVMVEGSSRTDVKIAMLRAAEIFLSNMHHAGYKIQP